MGKIALITTLILQILLSTCFLAHAKEKKHVLYLNSYHYGYRWSDRLLQGILSIFDESEYKVDLQIEYMDAKKYNYEYISSRLLTLYREKFKDETFEAIIVSDNDALNFIQSYGEALFGDVPVVFCGINDISSVELTRKNITGVAETFDLISTIDVARRLHPEKRRMIFIGDQATAGGRAIKRQITGQLATYDKELLVEFWSHLTLEETLERIENLPEDTFLFFTPWYQTVQDKFYTTEEVMQAIYAHSSVPIYTAWEFLLGYGAIGGKLLSAFKHGQDGAKIALRILQGESVETIPIVYESPSEYMFDYRVMQRLQVDMSLLPTSSKVINSPRAFYELSKELFWTIMVSFILLVIAFIFLGTTMISRRRIERKVIEQLSFQGTLMDTLPQLVSWKDTKGNYLGANRTFLEFFGIDDLEDMVGKTIKDVADNDAYVQWSASADTAVVSNRNAFLKTRRKIIQYNGTHSWLEVHKVPLRDQAGRVVGILTTAENVTKEHNLEKQLLQSQKLEAIGTLAGGIAHDFNNILTSIINSTELAIGDVPADSQTAKDLRRVLKAARRGAGVVKQILSFSRPSKGKFRATDIGMVVKEVLSLMDVSLPATISVKSKLDTPNMFVNADPSQIHQVILNLCTNAFHSLRDNGGQLEVQVNEEVIHEERAAVLNVTPGRYVSIKVGDNGPGINPEILDKIFDPFFTTKDITDGTGLGLSVVLGIVKGHHGGIEVQSDLGKGTVITVYLPQSEKPFAFADRNRMYSASGQLSILFVEDDEDQLNTTPRILTDMGHRVEAVRNPMTALEMVKRDPNWFDLIISDYDMPKMSGIELATALHYLPVIIVSGREDAVTAAATCDNIVAVLVKPYARNDLQKTISAVTIQARRHTDVELNNLLLNMGDPEQ